MPTSTRSGPTDRSPQDSEVNAIATRKRGGTAKVRVTEVRVVPGMGIGRGHRNTQA